MKRKEFKEKEETKQRQYNIFWKSLKFFPGNISEYEKFIGYDVRVVNTGKYDMGVLYGTEEKDTMEVLIKENVEALVNGIFMISVGMVRRYGLPVTRSL